MANIDAELEQQLKEAGKKLSRPSDSIDELLALLDQIEKLLSKVDQSPKKSMLDVLEPSMEALIQECLLKHLDIDVKVAVASCVSEITRITAPDAPYDDDQMRDIFQLIVSSFEDIADQSSRSYIKRASILETVSKLSSCVIMLDLECDALIVEMFEHFLRSVRDYHHESIYPSMERIMVLVLEESEEIPVEMLKPLLARVKKDSEGVLPVARKLAEGVLLKSADKLKPYLMPAIVSLGDTLDKYTKVVASVWEGKTASGVQQANESKLEKEPVDEAQQKTEPQKRIGKETVAAKKVKPPPKGESEDDEATSESDAEPQKQTRKKAAAAKDVKLPPKDDSEDNEATSESDAKPQKRTGKKAAVAKEVKLPPKDDSDDDEATIESNAKPQKRTWKKAAAAKDVKLPPKDESEDDETTSESDAPPPKKSVSKSMKQSDKKSKLSGKKMDVGNSNYKKPNQTGKKVLAKVEDSDSDAKLQKRTGKKAAVAKEVKLPPKDDSDDDEATVESDAKPQKRTGKKAAAGKKVKLPPKDESEDDETTSESDAPPPKKSVLKSTKQSDKKSKLSGKKMDVGSSNYKKPNQTGKKVLAKVEDSDSDAKLQKRTGKKAAVAKEVKLPPKDDSDDDEATIESDAKPQKRTGKKAAAAKEVKLPPKDESEDDETTSESDAPPPKKSVLKSTKQSDKKSKLSGKKMDVGNSNYKKPNQTGKKVPAKVEMDYSPKSAAKLAKREGSSKEIPVNIANQKHSTVKDKVSDTIKYDESLVGSNRWPEDKMYYKGVIESFDAAKKKHKLLYVNGEKATLDLKTEKWEILKEYSVYDKANECKLVKESKYKAHQADESNLTTTSPDRTGQVFKEGACLEEVDSTILYSKLHLPYRTKKLEEVCLGVDVTGNQEASLDLEPSKKSEKEVINQEGHDMKNTDGTNKDKGLKPEDQTSQKRGKEDHTVINSTESMVGLAHKRARRETSDGSVKKSRVSRVAGVSSLASPCSTDATVEGRESDRTASGHLPLGDKDVMRYPSHQMFLPGASTPATEERARQMGPSGVVDRLQGMANESAALFSHAAESIHALEVDNSELKRQLNELVLRDKGYYEKISVLEGEVADLKSRNVQLKLTWEARAIDADRRATEAERRFAELKRKMEVENLNLKKQLDEYVLCDQGHKEKIRIMEREVADMKSLDEQTKLNLEARAVDAERRAKGAEQRLAEAKRKMEEAEGNVKAALASFAL